MNSKNRSIMPKLNKTRNLIIIFKKLLFLDNYSLRVLILIKHVFDFRTGIVLKFKSREYF